MLVREGLAISAVAALALLGGVRLAAQQPDPMAHHHPAPATPDTDNKVDQVAVNSMSPGHHHDSAHVKLTSPRPQTAEDQARAEE
ncbi:MAG TPA: hypothetical protein VHM88_27255, partial [Candidatus Acidoferrales bacterium]|nr:hypothetical protein [Candidatus Acidoferrales bacterium]